MFIKFSINSRSLFCRSQILVSSRSGVHYQIGKNGEKIVVSHRHHIKSEREEWQKVAPMGFEKELREIKRIERNERLHADPVEARKTAMGKLDQLKDKLLSAGFCRDRKSYDPSADVESRLDTLANQIIGSNSGTFSLSDANLKFKLLTACAQEFDHEVSNSQLHQMTTLDDVKQFYLTPVRGMNSYDHLVNQSSSLPKNLHVIPEAIRFNPETDKFFNGVQAFPGSRSQVVGLRAKKRYEEIPSRFEWPDV